MSNPAKNHLAWFRFADADLLNADNNVNSQTLPWTTVLFHAHQVIEKYLNVYLVARNEVPDKTHDLVPLSSKLHSSAPELAAYGAQLHVLTQLYIQARYPHVHEIPQEEAEQALALERAIRALILRKVQPLNG
jgi:HEPN domain-containing protein